MTSKKRLSRRTRESLLDHCGQLGADDCIDPNEYFKRESRKKTNKKAQQLCRQVAHTLELVLGDCDDAAMLSLRVIDVIPAPDCSRLMVSLRGDLPPDKFDHDDLMIQLNRQVARLRGEIARTIHRKRVPSLCFNLLPLLVENTPEVDDE